MTSGRFCSPGWSRTNVPNPDSKSGGPYRQSNWGTYAETHGTTVVGKRCAYRTGAATTDGDLAFEPKWDQF